MSQRGDAHFIDLIQKECAGRILGTCQYLNPELPLPGIFLSSIILASKMPSLSQGTLRKEIE
jgi:hypothetical protein